MPDVSHHRTGEFLRNLFKILIDHPDGLPARDALAKLKATAKLTDYEQGTFKSGAQRFEPIVRFATIGCVKAGWMVKHKGTWTVTEDGRQAFASYHDPDEFYRRSVKLYHEWKANRQVEDMEGQAEPDSESVANAHGVTFEQAEEQAWGEIEQYLRKVQPYEFQDMVGALLKAMGYHVSWIAPPGKDGGVDILAWSDPLGTRPPRIKVQVKRLGQNVTVDGVRSFMSLLGDDDVGIFVTTSGFTKDAADTARTQERRKITLIDLERFVDLWVEYYDRLDDTARRQLPLRPIHFLALDN